MATIDRSLQPIVKDSSGVLVGVAQIRVGKPSIREAGTAVNAPALVAVGKSNKKMAVADSTVCLVRPTTVYQKNGTAAGVVTATPAVTISGAYSGKVDGALIVRATATAGAGIKAEAAGDADADVLEIFNTYGELVYTSTAKVLGTPACVIQGLTLGATFVSPKVGDTWVIPVWAGNSLNMNQTGIISPFSLFYDATDSIGGLKSASFQPKIDGIKKLESGFPSYVADQIIDKVSVDVSWSGYEYTNSKLSLLKQMISRVINTGELSSISVEAVMRTRGGQLVRMWIPSATFTSLPTYAPTNDYSDVAFAMSALKMTEYTTLTDTGLDALDAAKLKIYNGWLADAAIYNELSY